MHPMFQAAINAAQKLTDEEQGRIGQAMFQLIAKMSEEKNGPFEIRPGLGGGKGLILYMADDFDAPLDDFKDYM